MQIELTQQERLIWQRLAAHRFETSEFELNKVALSDQKWLIQELLKRDIIPEQRLRYFIDPEYNASKSKMSHQQIFERNGTKGEEVFDHPHFRKYLSFFIEGADLPATMKELLDERFELTQSEDFADLVYQYVLTNKKNLEIISGWDCAEEIYKYLIDKGVVLWKAQQIRQKVKQLIR